MTDFLHEQENYHLTSCATEQEKPDEIVEKKENEIKVSISFDLKLKKPNETLT